MLETSTLSEQPAAFAFDDQSEHEINDVLRRYPDGRAASGVIPLLYIVQRQMARSTGSAWVPRVAMDVVAARLKMAPIRVYEVATFYLMFNTTPVGTFHLQVCGTTPCLLRGSDDVRDACFAVAGVTGYGQTGADGVFTVTEVECMGACVNAPVLVIGDDYYEDLDGPRTAALLADLRDGRPRAPGSTIGRLNSAPEGGATTLQHVPAE